MNTKINKLIIIYQSLLWIEIKIYLYDGSILSESRSIKINLFKIKSSMDGSCCFEKLGSQDSRVPLNPHSWFQENQNKGN